MRKVVVLISALVAIAFPHDAAFGEHPDVKTPSSYAQLSQTTFLKKYDPLSPTNYLHEYPNPSSTERKLFAQYQLAMCYALGRGFPKNNQKAFSLLTEVAQQGLPEAQVILANWYLDGFIAPKNKNQAALLYRQAAFSKKPIALLAQGCFLQNSDPKTAFALFLEAAQQSDALAEYYVSSCYSNGIGTEKNKTEATNWLEKSALHKNPQALDTLAVRYLSGHGETKDIKKAVSLFHDSAELGSPIAQFNYGIALWHGNGVPSSKTEAVKWFLLSANQDYPPAEERMGLCNFYGIGIPINHQQAFYWNKKAAQHGVKESQCLLGFIYDQGLGTSQEHEMALTWYQKAAEQNDRRAQFKLAYDLLKKTDPASIDEGTQLLKKSADAGYGYAQHYLAGLLISGKHIEKNEKLGIDLYRKAAEQGIPESELVVGEILLSKKNFPEGVEWVRKAVDKGLPQAYFRYGICYMDGIGFKKDPVEANRWFRCGALHGNPAAQNALGYSYFIGSGVPKDFVEAYTWYLLAEPQETTPYIKQTIEANIRNILPQLTTDQIKEAKEKASQFIPIKENSDVAIPAWIEIG